jgi:aspartate/methionine/tyrosine aminotransferase
MRELALPHATTSMPRSGIRAFMDRAWAAGEVIHLEVGEPNFPTPRHIVRAADRAARAGQTRYAPNAGISELREAIAAKLLTRNDWPVTSEDVVVTAGGVQALYLTMLALLEPGDAVLVPDPGWPNFRMIVTVLSGSVQPYPLRPEEQYQPSVADLEEAATASTRAVILNSPSNPLGAVATATRIRAVLAWARERGIWVISDECYDEITFDDSFVSAGSLGSPEHLISCYSFSKTYAMTGWRVGYAVTVHPELRAGLAKLQEPVISCVNAPAQAAAVAAMTGSQQVVADMRAAYRTRRDAAVAALRAGGVPVMAPAGAFYLWLDVSAWASDDWEFAVSLLDQAGVAVAPGSAFGGNGAGHVRISLATDLPVLLAGIARIVERLHGMNRPG